MKQHALMATLGVALLSLVSCAGSGTDSNMEGDKAMSTTEQSMDQATPAEPEGVAVGGAMMIPSRNIVENALNSKDHTTLVAAVKAAGLVETLSGPGPFTVFAPTNEAFAKVPEQALNDLMKPEHKADLTKVLTYHVVSGAYTSADLKDGMELTTVEGKKIKLMMKDGAWWVNGARITIPDVISSNGVTYVIDGVLMP